MSKERVCAAIVLLCAAACGGSGDAPKRPATLSTQSNGPASTARREERGPRDLIIGTSITAGLGLDDPSDAYPAVLQHIADSVNVPMSIVNAGLSGETSAGALRRGDWLLSDTASVVIIETGANDGLRGLDPDSTAANIHALVSLVRTRIPRATVLLAQMEAPPNLGADYTQRFHDLYGSVARKTGVTLMPFLLDGVAGDAALNQGDGIHPNVAGAAKVARNVWASLRPLLAPPSR